jgi:hypothetical protein
MSDLSGNMLLQNRRRNLSGIGGIPAGEVVVAIGENWCQKSVVARDTGAGRWKDLRLLESLLLAHGLASVKVGVDARVSLVQSIGLVRSRSVRGRTGAGAVAGASTAEASTSTGTGRTVCTGGASSAQTGGVGASGAVSTSTMA